MLQNGRVDDTDDLLVVLGWLTLVVGAVERARHYLF